MIAPNQDGSCCRAISVNSSLGEKISEFLKRPAGANRIVYIASSIDVNWGTVVNIINRVRERGVDRIGLIVESNDHTKKRFLLQIPGLRDPNEDLSKLKPSPLPLGVVLSTDLQLKLIKGGIADAAYGHFPIGLEPYGNSEVKGTLNDSSSLSQTLAQIFRQRKEQHVYKPGMETRWDVPEDERVEKTVVIKASALPVMRRSAIDLHSRSNFDPILQAETKEKRIEIGCYKCMDRGMIDPT